MAEDRPIVVQETLKDTLEAMQALLRWQVVLLTALAVMHGVPLAVA